MLWRASKSPWLSRALTISRKSSSEILARASPSLRHTRCLYEQTSKAGVSPAPVSLHHATLEDNRKEYESEQSNAVVKIRGLVRSVRKQKKVSFARVADGSTLGSVQAVFPHPNMAKE